MARPRQDDRNQTQTLLPTVLDRLVDHDRKITFLNFQIDRSKILDHLESAVRENLEWLLNVRQESENITKEHAQLKSSISSYGLPDMTSSSVGAEKARKLLSEAIEAAIAKFEPRLTDIKVIPMPINEMERRARFQIQAKLLVQPAPEPVAYVTTMELGAHNFSINIGSERNQGGQTS